MNQIQTLIDAAREALASNGIHDTILAVGIAAIPILIFCVIVNRLRHPDRSFLAAMALSVLGFFLVPSVATGTAILGRGHVCTPGTASPRKRPNPTRPSSPTSPLALADPSVRRRVNTTSKTGYPAEQRRRSTLGSTGRLGTSG